MCFLMFSIRRHFYYCFCILKIFAYFLHYFNHEKACVNSSKHKLDPVSRVRFNDPVYPAPEEPLGSDTKDYILGNYPCTPYISKIEMSRPLVSRPRLKLFSKL